MSQLQPQTPEQMIAMFENLVEDTLDTDFEYQLLNEVKDDVECGDLWAKLKSYDGSQTSVQGDTYLSMKTLPADFGIPSQKGIYVGDDLVPYIQVDFEDRELFKDINHRYYIDLANDQYALCGTAPQTGTIKFFYQKTSPGLAAGVSPASGTPWIFPARFHPVLPYMMAKKFYAIDQGDKSRAYDDRWDIYSEQIIGNMRRWNAQMLKQAIQNRNAPLDVSADPRIIDMNGGGRGSIYG